MKELEEDLEQRVLFERYVYRISLQRGDEPDSQLLLPFAISVEEVSHVIASPSIVETALQFPRREQMILVLDMTEYSVHGAREALNVSLAQYEPLMLAAGAMATCFLLSIATSAVNSAVLVFSDDGTSQSLFL